MDNKINISYSQISQFLECRYKHYLGYTKKLKTKSDTIHLHFGTTIHATIEDYLLNKRSKEYSYKFFNDNLITPETIKKYNSSDLVRFRTQGIIILREFFGKYNWKAVEILNTEYALDEQIMGNFYFEGYIDLIYKYKYIFIADYKTATREWNSYKFNDEYYGLQLKLYKYFYCIKNNIPFDLVKIFYIVLNRNEDNGVIPTHVTFHEVKSDREELLKRVAEVKSVLNTIYLPQYNRDYLRQTIGYNCNICEFNGTINCKGNIGTKFFREIGKKKDNKIEA